ncbi:MAG: hypothetical protein AAF141_11010 [Pseudomonadota bacterium]
MRLNRLLIPLAAAAAVMMAPLSALASMPGVSPGEPQSPWVINTLNFMEIDMADAKPKQAAGDQVAAAATANAPAVDIKKIEADAMAKANKAAADALKDDQKTLADAKKQLADDQAALKVAQAELEEDRHKLDALAKGEGRKDAPAMDGPTKPFTLLSQARVGGKMLKAGSPVDLNEQRHGELYDAGAIGDAWETSSA